MSRNTLDIMTLDDPERSGDFLGGELIGGYQVFKQAKRKTSSQMGYVSFYLPEDWIDPFMQAAIGRKPEYNFLLVKMPIKDSK